MHWETETGRRGGIACMLLALLAGCGDGGVVARTVPGMMSPPPPPSASAEVVRVFPQLSFLRPLALLQAPGDASRWFVVEQDGVVRGFDNVAAVTGSSVFLDIALRVDSAAEEAGLLGFAFDPDYANNGFVYAAYTSSGPFRSVVSRFTLDGTSGVVDAGSELILLEVPQPATNHNGGNLVFGPDGFLYVGLGDGGGAGDPDNNAQTTSNLLGTILRLNVDNVPPYTIPTGNVFAGNTECATGAGTQPCPEIFAWGLRNPWRFSFDQMTGELWVGDVGQGAWEEINRVDGGENFGWNNREGANCFPAGTSCATTSVDPITQYPHGDGFSVTGGYVYRGTAYPGLSGQYIFGDYVTGRIFRLPATAAQGTEPVDLTDTSLSISSFGQGEDGEIYVVDHEGGLYQITTP